MRISRISIANFRSIKDLTVNLPHVCALVGPNNAGKSNLLEAIHRVIGRDWVSKTSFRFILALCRFMSSPIIPPKNPVGHESCRAMNLGGVMHVPFLWLRTEEEGPSDRQSTDASDGAVDSRVVPSRHLILHANDSQSSFSPVLRISARGIS